MRAFLMLSNDHKLLLLKIIFTIVVLFPFLLLLLPANFFDSGQSLCLSQLFFKKSCPACGMTRSIMHLIHLEFEEAFAYNMMGFVVLPFLCVLWLLQIKSLLKQIERSRISKIVKNHN